MVLRGTPRSEAQSGSRGTEKPRARSCCRSTGWCWEQEGRGGQSQGQPAPAVLRQPGDLGARLAEVAVISAAVRCTFYQELSRCQESETGLVIDHLPRRRIP